MDTRKKIDLAAYRIETLAETKRKMAELEEKLTTVTSAQKPLIENELIHFKNLELFLRNEQFYSMKHNPEAMSLFETLFKKTTLENIKHDAKPLMRFLSSPTLLQRTSRTKTTDHNGCVLVSGTAKETVVTENRIHFLSNHLPHVIFIPGNNDFNQLDDALCMLRELKKKLMQNMPEDKCIALIANIPIVFSGKGGHGVAPGSIFATSEAKTQSMYFQRQFELLIGNGNIKPLYVYEEEQSTNSGENIDFTKPIMRQFFENALKEEKINPAEFRGICVWLIPTPVGGIRQLATFCQQAENETKFSDVRKSGGPGYRVNSVYMLPDEESILEHYFSHSKEHAYINLFSALREVVNWIGYMLENDFMSAHAPDEMRLRDAIKQLIKYYKTFTGKLFDTKDKQFFADDLVLFSKLKEKTGGIAQLKETENALIHRIKKHFDPIQDYFKKIFSQIERQQMEKLDEKNPRFTLKTQQAYIDLKQNKKLFDIYGLDSTSARENNNAETKNNEIIKRGFKLSC